MAIDRSANCQEQFATQPWALVSDSDTSAKTDGLRIALDPSCLKTPGSPEPVDPQTSHRDGPESTFHLINRARARDRDALERLFTRHLKPLGANSPDRSLFRFVFDVNFFGARIGEFSKKKRGRWTRTCDPGLEEQRRVSEQAFSAATCGATHAT